MSTKRALHLFILVLLLVSAIPPLGSARAQGDGGDAGIQSTPGDDCSTAPNLMQYDDGGAEASSRLSAGSAVYVQRFTPPAYPYRVTRVCVAFRQRNPPDYALLPYNVVIFADSGAGPGAPLYTFADTATNLVNGVTIWYSSAVDYVINSGSVYIGVQWDATTYGENQVRLDTTVTTPLNPGYRSADGGTTWEDMLLVNGAYRALSLRAGGLIGGINVNPTGPTTLTEGGPAQAYTFTLTSAPAAAVTIPVAVSSGECTLTGGPNIVLDGTNWNTGAIVTVTPVDDVIVDGNLPCNLVTGDPTSADPVYNALTAADSPDVLITVNDNDTAGINVNPAGPLSLNEPGPPQVFTFTLTSPPTAAVTIPVSVSSGECTLTGGPNVVLDGTSWNLGVPVTVTPVNDVLVDGDLPCNLVTGDPTSADPAYNALTAADSPDVLITILDDDVPAAASILVAPTGPLSLPEAGGTQVFTFTLGTQPAGGADVAFPVAVSSGECTLVGGPTVTIPNASWNTGVSVTVNAVNDVLVDGDLPCNLVTGDPTSADPAYNALTAADSPDVLITILDDDTPVAASILVAPTGPLSLPEAGGTQAFTFTLGTQPAGGADVAFPVAVSSGECTLVGGPTVTIPNASWNTGVSVTVNAVNDALIDGDLPCNLVTGDPTSADPAYDALTAADSPDVLITILDDDAPVTPAIVVAPTALTVSEPNTTNTFNMAATTAPTADIDIPLTVSDPGECLVNGLAATTVTIPMATWAAGVNVTVSAVDDTIADGAQPCTITTGPAVSGDPVYNGMDPANVVVIVLDNETRPPSGEPKPTGPTAADHARAQAPLCADLDGSTHPLIRASVPGGTVTNGGVYCRILANGGVFVNQAGAGEIGNMDVIQMGVIHAVDIFGMSGGYSVPNWNSSITACLQGSGRIMYLDALTAPRALVALPTYPSGGYTCAVLYHAGTIVLVP